MQVRNVTVQVDVEHFHEGRDLVLLVARKIPAQVISASTRCWPFANASTSASLVTSRRLDCQPARPEVGP